MHPMCLHLREPQFLPYTPLNGPFDQKFYYFLKRILFGNPLFINTSLKRKQTFEKTPSLYLHITALLHKLNHIPNLTMYRSDNQNYLNIKLGNLPPSLHQISYQQCFPRLKNRQIVHCMYRCGVH